MSGGCATSCEFDPSHPLRYGVGRAYRFAYAARAVTAMRGTSDQESAAEVAAVAEVHVLSPCNMVLKLSDVAVSSSGSPASALPTSSTLESLPLPFAFSPATGEVHSLCPSPAEDPWSLNLKRGVLSAFQTGRVPTGAGGEEEEDEQVVINSEEVVPKRHKSI